MKISCDGRWLVADLGRPHRMLSWSIAAPGFVEASRVVWRGVRNADLPVELDPVLWLKQEMEAAGHGGAVGLLTSRNIHRYHSSKICVEEETVTCLATAGLSNAERVGRRQGYRPVAGTINILVQTSRCLTQAAMIEAMAIAVEARTLAVLEGEVPTRPDGAAATGTGTDCVVIASPVGAPECAYAGLHTALGEAVGAAVLSAMRAAISEWLAESKAGALWAAE
jgi:adenosylcobinamide amidohydrolase